MQPAHLTEGMQLNSHKNAKKIDLYQASLIMKLVISFYTDKNRKRASQVMKTGLHLLKYTEERHVQSFSDHEARGSVFILRRLASELPRSRKRGCN